MGVNNILTLWVPFGCHFDISLRHQTNTSTMKNQTHTYQKSRLFEYGEALVRQLSPTLYEMDFRGTRQTQGVVSNSRWARTTLYLSTLEMAWQRAQETSDGHSKIGRPVKGWNEMN